MKFQLIFLCFLLTAILACKRTGNYNVEDEPIETEPVDACADDMRDVPTDCPCGYVLDADGSCRALPSEASADPF